MLVFLKDPRNRDERGLSQSAETAILIAGAVTVALGRGRPGHGVRPHQDGSDLTVRIRSRDERGLSESAQWAVLFSLLMLVTLGIIQAGIYLHGRNVAQRAATAAVDAARGSFGTTAEAQQLAADIARGGGLEGVTVRITRGSSTVTAEVTGHAPSMIDIGIAQVHGVGIRAPGASDPTMIDSKRRPPHRAAARPPWN